MVNAGLAIVTRGPAAAGGLPGALVTRSGWDRRMVAVWGWPVGVWWMGCVGSWFVAMR